MARASTRCGLPLRPPETLSLAPPPPRLLAQILPVGQAKLSVEVIEEQARWVIEQQKWVSIGTWVPTPSQC